MAKKVEVDAKLLIAAIALLIVATVGSAFATYLIFARGNPEAAVLNGEAAEKKRSLGPTFDVGEFTLNLASTTNQMRFIRAQIVLEGSNNKVISDLEARNPQIRDQLIRLLRSRTVEELNSADGMERLRVDILQAMNSLVTRGEVTDVFFIDLIFQ